MAVHIDAITMVTIALVGKWIYANDVLITTTNMVLNLLMFELPKNLEVFIPLLILLGFCILVIFLTVTLAFKLGVFIVGIYFAVKRL